MAGRRAPGEGTYKTLPSGLVRLVVRVDGRDVGGPAMPTKAEAKRAWHQMQRERNAAAAEVRSPSLSRWAETWIQNRRSLSPSTVETYGYWAKALGEDSLGSIPVADVNEQHLRAWLERQSGSPFTSRKRLGWIHQLLRAAGNSARYRPPTVRRSSRRPLTPQEAAKVYALLPSLNELERTVTLLAMECGLRRSEIAGLKHEDREEDGIRLQRVVLRLRGQMRQRSKGKSSVSLSWVPLPESLKGAVGPPSTGYVASDDGSRPMQPQRITEMIKRVARKAGVESVSFLGAHTLRRTYGMTLLEAGVDVVTAAELMRHDPQMLLKEYARSRDDLKRKAVERAFQKGEQTPEQTRRPQKAQNEPEPPRFES